MRPCGSRYVWSDWVTVKVARGRRRRWRQRRGLMVAYVCDAAQVAFTATTISWSVARSLAHSFMHSFVIRYHSFRFVSSRFGRICNLHGQQQYSQMSFNWFASFPSTCDRAHTHTHRGHNLQLQLHLQFYLSPCSLTLCACAHLHLRRNCGQGNGLWNIVGHATYDSTRSLHSGDAERNYKLN